MRNIYFYDLPVYRLNKDEYYKKMKEVIETKINAIKQNTPPTMLAELKLKIQTHQFNKFGPWEFNEIIGYIRLYFLGNQVRGEYYSTEKMRTSLGRKKIFIQRTHKLSPEMDLGARRTYTNSQIWEKIKQYIKECRKQLPKERVLDDSLLMNIGPHIDWMAILKRISEEEKIE